MGTDFFGPFLSAKDTTYVYDSFGQLTRENNKTLDKTFVYSYNGIGNIANVKTYAYTTGAVSGTPVITSYTYDGTQVDRLASFGGKAITYDANGCVNTYDDWTYTWTKGRLTKRVRGTRLSGIDTYTYTYDAYGRRTSKNYRFMKGTQALAAYMISSSTNYTYDASGRLIREQYTEIFNDLSSNSREIIYLYDENGVIGVMYSYNGSTSAAYFYRRNLQGDVTAIYNREGNRVGEYAYDAWGNCTILSGASNDLVSNNPIRYRGYYFDAESGVYFLNARYYNPQWRRFISPDSTEYIAPETPNGLNLYAYCYNDPVNYVDPSGHFGFWAAALIGVGVLALAGFFATINADSADDGKPFNGSIGADAYFWNTLVAGSIGGLIGGLIFTFAPTIIGFLGSSFTLGSYALASGEAVAITISGAQIAGGAIAAAGIGLTYFAYEGKKAAPRIRSNTKKQAYDKAFYKGGKRKPILHQNGKYGPHFHPANPKYKHWHFYFSFLLAILGIDMDDFD